MVLRGLSLHQGFTVSYLDYRAPTEMLLFIRACSVTQSCLTLCDPIDYGPTGSSVEFSRQEYWSGFAFPSPGNLLGPGTTPMFLTSPALVGGFYHEHHLESSLCPWMDAKLLLLRGGIKEDILFGHLAFITLHNVGFLIQFFSKAC